MTHPLGSIKDLTTGTLAYGVTFPARLAARAYGVTKGAVQVGQRVAREASGPGARTVWKTADQPAPRGDDLPKPVNVVEELGLDAAPFDEPRGPAPVTSIDAQADPVQVTATPADVAQRIARTDGQG